MFQTLLLKTFQQLVTEVMMLCIDGYSKKPKQINGILSVRMLQQLPCSISSYLLTIKGVVIC